MRFLVFAILIGHSAFAQTCVDDYFVTTYTGINNITLARAVSNSNKELICVGSIDHSKPGELLSDGWISKFSANGTPLWSKRYSTGVLDFLQLRDIVQASNETYLVVGQVSSRYNDGNSSNSETRAVMLHIDKYGNLLQSIKYEAGPVTEMQTYFLNINKASDNNFIIEGTCGFNRGLGDTRGFYLSIDLEGRIKWLTRFEGSVAFPSVYRNAILKIQGNKFVSAIPVAAITPPDLSLQKLGYYFFCLDLSTGQKLWDKCYTFSNELPDLHDPGAVSFIKQLGNGDFSFKSYYNDSVQLQPPYLRKSLSIVTSNTGDIKDVEAFSSDQLQSRTTDGYADGANSTMLLVGDGRKAMIIESDENDNLKAVKGYSAIQPGLEAVSLLKGINDGKYIFGTNRSNSKILHLLKTDDSDNIECATMPVALQTEDATKNFKKYEGDIQVITTGSSPYALPSIPVNSSDYPLQMNVDCRRPCCENKIDTADAINLCDASTHVLPDGNIVRSRKFRTGKWWWTATLPTWHSLPSPTALHIKCCG